MIRKTRIFAIALLFVCAFALFAACDNKEPQSETEFTVNFLNYDGNVLRITSVKRGEVPVYDGTPTRPSDETYTYVFAGWKDKNGQIYNQLPQIYANTAFTAEYSAQKRTYKVTFRLPGSNVEVYVEAGTIPAYDGSTRIEYEGKTYTIVGWDKDFAPVYSEQVYTARLKADEEEVTTSKVTFVVEDEQITFVYPVGTTPRFFGTPYKKAAEHAEFVFDGWQGEDGTKYSSGTALPATTEQDVTYTALFDKQMNVYKVRLYDFDGTLLSEISAEYGTLPAFEGDCTRKSTEKYDYAFVGWTDGSDTYETLPVVTGNIVLRAVYTATLRKYTLTINYTDGVAAYVDKLAYGDAYGVTSPSVSGKYADKPFVSGVITEDTAVNVSYATAVVWDGSISASLGTAQGASGTAGSKTNPYIVASGADLAYIAEQSFQTDYGADTYYKLTADIDLASISWKPICAASGMKWNYFKGNFDGDNHTIYNLKADTKYKKAGLGLFGGISGSVSNLTVTGEITAQNRLGAICYVLKGGKLTNVNAYVNITATAADNGAYVGGLAGNASAGFEITNSNNYGKVVCTTQSNVGNYVGGIVGLVAAGAASTGNKIVGCANYGSVQSYRWAGGIVGYVAAPNAVLTVQRCDNYGNVSTNANASGGIVGFAESSDKSLTGNVKDCANYATVSGNDYVGGICGWAKSLNTEDCTNYGYVKGHKYVGGVCGAVTDKNLLRGVNRGNVYGTSTSTGGVCGSFVLSTVQNKITDCANYGNVTNASAESTAAVGGICGSVKSATIDGKLVSPVVDNCTNGGDVNGLNNFVGGVVGSNNGGKITGGSNYGYVHSQKGVYVGGIAGSNYGYGYVGNCVNTGLVVGFASVGQICGQLTETSTAEGNTEHGFTVGSR